MFESDYLNNRNFVSTELKCRYEKEKKNLRNVLIMFFIITVALFAAKIYIDKNYVTVDATYLGIIKDIKYSNYGTTEKICHLFNFYDENGKLIEAKKLALNFNKTDINKEIEPKKVRLKINPEKPESFVMVDRNPILFYIIYGIFAYGVFGAFLRYRKVKKAKESYENYDNEDFKKYSKGMILTKEDYKNAEEQLAKFSVSFQKFIPYLVLLLMFGPFIIAVFKVVIKIALIYISGN